MIRVEAHDEITFIRMCRSFFRRPVFWGGAYLVDGLLIDCGPPVTSRELIAALEGRRVDALVVTHHHEDHYGAAPLLLAARGITAQVPARSRPLLAAGFPTQPYRWLAWGAPPRLPETRPLAAEVETRSLRLEVVPTPGHSHDHVCFFERERGWLFSGDLFLAERLRYLRDDEDLAALVASLRHVAALPLERVFCAHRGPVRDGPAALRRKAENLETLYERTRELLAQGVSEREIARRVVGRDGPLRFLSLGRFSARNFVRAVARQR
jgi:glyoxylase-like metal-dependent hydrolase (beta-lactamase superfamily II)